MKQVELEGDIEFVLKSGNCTYFRVNFEFSNYIHFGTEGVYNKFN